MQVSQTLKSRCQTLHQSLLNSKLTIPHTCTYLAVKTICGHNEKIIISNVTHSRMEMLCDIASKKCYVGTGSLLHSGTKLLVHGPKQSLFYPSNDITFPLH